MELIWHKYYNANKKGLDWFVGDIHGNYDILMSSLELINFNFKDDRLFCVGDLINKGPDSKSAALLLTKKWFNGILGNHELMLIEAASDRSVIDQIVPFGGSWMVDLTPAKLNSLANLFLSKLSLSATISSAKKSIGLVHASSPENWEYLQIDPPTDDIKKTLIDYCLWDFGQGNGVTSGSPIRGIDAIVSGHISTDKIVTRNNHIWIDTISKTGSLTIINTHQVLELIKQ